jgi:hypothetical protein
MQVHHVFATAGKIALGCFVVFACAALATVGTYLGLGLGGLSLRSPVPSPDMTLVSPIPVPADNAPSTTPAEVVAARFPEAEAAAAFPAASTFFASVIPGDGGEPFDLSAVSGLAAIEPAWPPAEGAASATGAPEEPEPAQQSDPTKPEPSKAPAAGAPPHRAAARSSNVLNDAMIASIRQRLKLTAEQQKLWPAVEAALRKIVYTKAAFNPQGRGQPGGGTAYIDPASAEVRELKSAALPLIMRLNDEQKREVRMLAYVMGLEAVASQF